MTTLAIQWIMANDNGNPKDACMNTWHFVTNNSEAVELEATDCVARMAAFYDAIDEYLSFFLSGAVAVKAFDLNDPEPRVPVLEATQSMTVSSEGSLPCEVAACLSFQAPRVSGESQARRRGRFYIGPLANSLTVTNDTAAGDMILGAGFRADLADAAAAAAGSFVGTEPDSLLGWCTFSPTAVAGGATIDAASHLVTDGWIDFAIDIQRRRGHAPGGRTLWTD